MEKIKKDYNFGIIVLFIAFIFSFESTGYCLRVPMGAVERRAQKSISAQYRKTLLDVAIDVAREHGTDFVLLLYGSVARDEARPDSDVDFSVDVAGETKNSPSGLSPAMDIAGDIFVNLKALGIPTDNADPWIKAKHPETIIKFFDLQPGEYQLYFITPEGYEILNNIGMDELRGLAKTLKRVRNENSEIEKLEKIARGEISDKRAGEVINRLLQLGTERADVQRALLLYNRLKGKPIQGILKNYHLDGASVEFVPEKGVDFIMDGDGSLDNLFKDKKVMVIETHPDDAIINIGHIIRKIVSVAKEFMLITAIPDQAGVTDKYTEEFDSSLMPPDLDHSNKDKVKRWIRAQEAKLGAQLLGIEGNRYVNLDLDFPLEKPKYDDAGNLLSYESIFKAPTKEDIKKIEEFVKLHGDTDVYLLAFPFSNHPHHRAVTNLFLNAIYKYNRKAGVIFWEDDEEFGQHKIPQNLFYFFREGDQKIKEGNMRQAYKSQNNRRKEDYYVSRMKESGLKNAKNGYVQLARKSFVSTGEIGRIRKEMPYAESLLKIKIVEPLLASNKSLATSLDCSAVRICQ